MPRRRTSRFLIVVFLLFLFFCADIIFRFFFTANASEPAALPGTNHPEFFEPFSYGVVKPNLHLRYNDEKYAFDIHTNSFGMRMDEVSLTKQPDTVRIAVLGDSIAFGWLLPQEKSFPSLTQKILNEVSVRKYEVLNFAAPTYTSFHGLKQYERLVHNFNPDVLVLSFGLFDSYTSNISEQDYYALLESSGLNQSLSGVPKLFHDFSTFGHWYLQRQKRENLATIQSHLETVKDIRTVKVEPAQFKQLYSAIIEHHRSNGGKTVLLNINLKNFHVEPVLYTLQQEKQIPLLDMRNVVDHFGTNEDRKLRYGLELAHPGPDYYANASFYPVLLRVHVPPGSAVSTPSVITDTRPLTENPNAEPLALFDDGTKGDEIAGDRVWSRLIELKEADDLYYAFTTNPSLDSGVDDLISLKIRKEQLRLGHPYIDQMYTYNQLPYQKFVFEDLEEFPNEMLHEMTAKRLARILQDVE